MATPSVRHPAWAEELKRRYLRGEASQFILHGNVFDLIERGGELVSFQSYLAETLLGETKDSVFVYNVSTGGRFVKRRGEAAIDELLLQRAPEKVIPALERALKAQDKL